MDLVRLGVDEFCNYTYAWIIERVEDREKFDYELNRDEGGSANVTTEYVADEMAAFAAFAGLAGTHGGQ